ncbi:MAG TPA: DNA polymerase III subunit delta [Candidatus Coprenecus pullistercoris]|nr:DNA polymerase III subunit delta [Candidatus Coprenecus pullistercoris]
MAKTDTAGQFESLSRDIASGKFSPVYILMGEESFYPERLCSLIMEKALSPEERDFNQTILYGQDTDADEIISNCERYPMMSERVLVIVREAQAMKKPEKIGLYLDHISPSTVLVLLFSGKNMDKRTSLFKKITASDACTVFESTKIREEAMPRWIESYFRSIGKNIEPQGAVLLAEYAGNDLRKISVEADKLTKAVPPEQPLITARDIEDNVGISREFNTSELTSALAARNGDKAFRIVYFFSQSPRQYPLQMTLGFLFYFFSKVEMMHALMLRDRISAKDAAAKAGIYYSYAGPYLNAVANYSLRKTMTVISYIKDCDLRSKSGSGGAAGEGDLLTDLAGRILSL